MGTRVYVKFPSPAQEAAFLGIDDTAAVEGRLAFYDRWMETAFYDDDQGWEVYKLQQQDKEVAELSDLQLFGFGRVNQDAIPPGMDRVCGGVPIDHPDAPWLLYTAGNCQGVERYGFRGSSDAYSRLKACGCTEIYWC